MKARELEAEIEAVLGPHGRPEERRGLIFGEAEREVARAGFCWSATEKVLEEAAQRGCEAVVAHEILYVPGGKQELGLPADHPELPANRKRRELMEKHGFAFLQYHSPLDNWPVWGVGRALADALGLDIAKADWPRKDVPVLPVPVLPVEPRSLRAFAEHVRERLDMTGVGVAGDLDRTVTRAALICGGFGKRWRISELARIGGADVMVTGELLDYSARAAIEADIAIVQASHYTTENPAVKKLAEHMRPRLEGKCEVLFLDTGESVSYYGREL